MSTYCHSPQSFSGVWPPRGGLPWTGTGTAWRGKGWVPVKNPVCRGHLTLSVLSSTELRCWELGFVRRRQHKLTAAPLLRPAALGYKQSRKHLQLLYTLYPLLQPTSLSFPSDVAHFSAAKKALISISPWFRCNLSLCFTSIMWSNKFHEELYHTSIQRGYFCVAKA